MSGADRTPERLILRAHDPRQSSTTRLKASSAPSKRPKVKASLTPDAMPCCALSFRSTLALDPLRFPSDEGGNPGA